MFLLFGHSPGPVRHGQRRLNRSVQHEIRCPTLLSPGRTAHEYAVSSSPFAQRVERHVLLARFLTASSCTPSPNLGITNIGVSNTKSGVQRSHTKKRSGPTPRAMSSTSRRILFSPPPQRATTTMPTNGFDARALLATGALDKLVILRSCRLLRMHAFLILRNE